MMSDVPQERMIAVVDLETTIRGKSKKNKASAFHEDNFVVLSGWGNLVEDDAVILTDSDAQSAECFRHMLLKNSTLIGQNIGFDLHHLRKQYEVMYGGDAYKDDLAAGNMTIFDTQIAEYLLSGQTHSFAKLDDLSVKYGGELKDDQVTAFWNAGLDTTDIPIPLLSEYLEGDLTNTAIVANAQINELTRKGMMPLATAMMDARLATIEMEYNGLHIDRVALDGLMLKYERKRTNLIDYIQKGMIKFYGDSRINDDINLNSNKQLGALLFGGGIPYKVKEGVGLFKNGNIKYKTITKTHKFSGLFDPEEVGVKKTPSGQFQVDVGLLNKLLGNYCKGLALRKNLLTALLELRGVEKHLGTYFKNYSELADDDDIIHHQLNHAITKTGRLSSSNPNLQNVTSKGGSPTKAIFDSRWGSDGVIIEADYSQLEVICLAHLSGCEALKDDLKNGVDIHAGTGYVVYGNGYTMSKDERRDVKGVVFGLIYGGGAKTLSEQTGVPLALTKTIIEAFYTRYPGIKTWQDAMYGQVVSTRNRTSKYTKAGYPQGKSVLVSETGREYVFLEHDNSYSYGPKTSFSPTEIKNYPVQGLATGDIVPIVIGRVYRALIADEWLRHNCLMTNTVHDSLKFDCKKDYADRAMKVIKKVMEDAPAYLKELFGIDFVLPLRVEISEGPTWKDQTVVDM